MAYERIYKASAGALAVILSLLLATAPNLAFADVRGSDVIVGESAIERDLPIAKCPSVSAEFAYLVDKEGTVYFERNPNTSTKIASLTKIMTAIVVLENADLKKSITISQVAGTMDGSSAELKPGDSMSIETALSALLIPSGNDAAQALAECVGADLLADETTDYGEGVSKPSNPVDAFVALMNKKAKELGCKDTLYVNPHGLDDGDFVGSHHSTAYDQSLVTACAMKDETFRKIVAEGTGNINITRGGKDAQITLDSTDWMIGNYQGAIGVKTGFTDLAGGCYSGAAQFGDLELYAIVLDSEDEQSRFQDAINLFNWVKSHRVDFQLLPVSRESVELTLDGEKGSYPVFAEVGHTGWIDKTFKTTIEHPNDSITVFDLDGNVSIKAHYDITKGNVRIGQKVGTLDYVQRNNVIATVDLIAAEDFYGPNIFQVIGVWWDRIWLSLDGKPTSAVTEEVYTVQYLVNKNASVL